MPRELEVQKFLRSGNTLSDLAQRYDIQYSESPDLGIVVLNYRYLSPLDIGLVRECRALALEIGSWNVVSKSIVAFFEPDNPNAEATLRDFDWESAVAFEKLDGALVTLFQYKGEWRVCTRTSADGFSKVTSINGVSSALSWRELVETTLIDMGYAWDEYTSKLDPSIYYTFELCAPENRVIVVYPTRFMKLVAAVSAETLDEVSIFRDWPIEIPAHQPVGSMDEVLSLVSAHWQPYMYEGYVVVDKEFNRLKIRNPQFVRMLRTYSVDSEVSALREVVMTDTTGTTPPIEEPPPGEPPGGLSMSSVDVHGDLISRVLRLCKWMAEAWDDAKHLSEDQRKEHEIHKVWPSAIGLLEKGLGMTDVLSNHTEEEQVEALHRFEDHLGSN
jgi:hypothetical protein